MFELLILSQQGSFKDYMNSKVDMRGRYSKACVIQGLSTVGLLIFGGFYYTVLVEQEVGVCGA